MKNAVFLPFCMLIVTALVVAHSLFRESLSPAANLQAQVESAAQEKRAAVFQAQLAEARLADYQQDVATLLPSSLKGRGEPSYPLRQMASVTFESESFVMERASGLMEKGKKAFRDANYSKAIHLFNDVIAKYPDSSHVAEAHFLAAESQFLTKDFEASIETIEKMIDLFPDNELTGFALLRLGSIYETQDRIEDAGDVYRAVLGHFRQPEIIKQASTSLKSVSL
jgi:TolA-binding protein